MSIYRPPKTRLELVDLVDGREDMFLDEREANFFEAVKQGNLDQVKLMLNQDSSDQPVNINAINCDGLTPLQLAVDHKRLDIMKELLEQGADLKTALLQSVLDNDLECVQILLTKKQSDVGAIQGDGYITPMILATQMDHYEMVRLLLQHDQYIDEPCENGCNCKECENKSDMLRSQIAINSFRGLSSPDYMCTQYLMKKCGKKDPLTQAFELNTKFERRANEEQELKKEYLELSVRCKRFGVDLYNECRSTKEITALLDIQDEENLNKAERENVTIETKTFKRAIDSDHKEFIAHPHTQQVINSIVYKEVKNWRTRSLFYKVFVYIMYTIIFPALVVVYLLRPQHKISRLMKSPFVKFVGYTSQFMIFLALLVASALRDNHLPTILEYLIFIIVLGMIVQEFREMLRHKPRRSYFFKWWNIITAIMLTFFATAAVFWIIGFAITGGWHVVVSRGKTVHRFLLLGNSLFSLAIVVSVFHFIDLCQVNSVLGPLQLSLYRMLQDVFKFLLIFFAIFMAFALGVRNLYSYYSSAEKNIDEHVKLHELSTFSHSIQSMFWALFDKIDLKDFNTRDNDSFTITQETGKLLFAFYSICAVMVALNMLIAMMTHSFENISKDEDIQWKFSRTRLWLEFIEKGSNLPSPYNLIPNPVAFYHFIKRFRVSRRREHRNNVEENENETERKTIIKRLVRRYFLKRESSREKELSTSKDIENCKREIIKIISGNNESGNDESRTEIL